MCKALTPFPGTVPLPSSMRLIRAQFLPNHNHGLRKLLQPLVGEVCEGRGTAGSSRRGRFFSTVAVASSDESQNVRRFNKRLPKHERKIMVESFVKEYRSLNGGKFPTISAAQKEVGGSYYVIREIMQDLEYNFVHNPDVGMSKKSMVEKKGCEDIITPKAEVSRDREDSCSGSGGKSSSSKVEKVPRANVKLFTRDMQVSSENVENGVAKTEGLEVDYTPLSGSSEGDASTISQRISYEESERVTIIEHAVNKDVQSREMSDRTTSLSGRTLMEDMPNPGSKEHKDEFLRRSTSVEAEGSSNNLIGDTVDENDAKSGQGFVKPGISTSNTLHTTGDQRTPNNDGSRETSKENSKDEDAQVSPSIWTNLKVFADSIFSIWRKR